MNQKNVIALWALFCATALSAGAKAQSYSYTAINAPGSTVTTVRGINNAGVIVGYLGSTDAFSDTNGVFSNIDIAGAARTRARGINNNGAVVGFFKPKGPSGAQAFIQSGGSVITGSYSGADLTQGTGINDAGSIVGGYVVGNNQYAFQYVGGVASDISVPGSSYSYATGINNAGDVVGYYKDAQGNDQGFLRHNGVITTLSVPGAAVTDALGINNSGEIVGDYIPTVGGNELPFAKIGNVYVLLNVPQSIYANPTVTDATGVNDSGVIVGYSGLNDGSAITGYVATPIAGAPLNIALGGGSASAPVILPPSKVGSISAVIGGAIASQFYSFNWAGGAFGASLTLTGASAPDTYAFELCSGTSCATILDKTKIQDQSWTGALSDTLAPGAYTIGLVENQPGTDPSFTLNFDSAVSSAAPEPGAWALMLLGLGGIGGRLRGRRRQGAAATA